jgi:hypothetical protein
MGLVICDMSAPLDGYVTAPNDSRENPFGDGAGMLHDWLSTAATDQDRAILQDLIGTAGAIVMGRTSFEKNEGDGGWGGQRSDGRHACVRGDSSHAATWHGRSSTSGGSGTARSWSTGHAETTWASSPNSRSDMTRPRLMTRRRHDRRSCRLRPGDRVPRHLVVVSVALPSIQRDLALGQSDAQWLVIACGLTLGGFLLLGGRAADLLGRRRVA